ncbi:MAG: YebC/PmpR family DNA-binding transcriptional regulator [Holosporales bacterium]|jgi:YebC/PmpR family DNA-binding regulatory protein|nr:YebC/PmpR family DNA-binding transcriptional regulator [Holosporales bacterium]
MSGHSQFKNIMYRKGAQDAKRAKLFAKIAREITVATKVGGSDSNSNPRLRAALASAREQNMPKDNIERAMAKATGVGDTAIYEDVRYEGYGPAGVAIIVETLTDNRNRTASDVRSAFSKLGGNLGEMGSVAFSFDRVGSLIYPKFVAPYDKVFDFAIETGADNVEEYEEGYIQVTCSLESFALIREAFIKKFGDPVESGLIWVPNSYVKCTKEQKNTLIKLIEALEDNDDVQKVFYNLEDEIL